MKRAIEKYVREDLEKKIVFLMGPRQVGKTTLAKSLQSYYDYLNYDFAEHRVALKKLNWDRKKPLIIFDELHKMPQWKRWIKGIYDTEGVQPKLLVTGSAKLNAYRKVGDSLAGRYFPFRLHPFDLKEVKEVYTPQEAFERLWECSGFPEPFLKGNKTYYQRWQRTHTDIILRQDLLDLESIRDIQSMETLIVLLRENVGSSISYANLARTLEKDAKTVKRWLQILEDLYIIFKVMPYSKKVARSLLKEPKYYFYDYVKIEDKGAKLENFVAAALLKELHFIEDVYGISGKLYFLRTKDNKEVDFLVTLQDKPAWMIEVKWKEEEAHSHFSHFEHFMKGVKKIQLVKELNREKTYPDGLEVRSLIPWLAEISLRKTEDES